MYLLFGGKDYEDAGGAKDLFGQYHTLSGALKDIGLLVDAHAVHGDGVWWHIYSVEDDCIVEES